MAAFDASALAFHAGMVASRRGWVAPVVVSVEDLSEQSPEGEPLIVVVSADAFPVEAAKQVSALSGAGRQVLVVLDRKPEAEVSAWLPDGVCEVAGTTVGGTGEESHEAGSSDDSTALSLPREPAAASVDDALVSAEEQDRSADDRFISPYCRFLDPSALRTEQLDSSGPAGEALRTVKASHSLVLREQVDGRWAGQWRLDDEGRPAVVWFKPCRVEQRPVLLVGATLGLLRHGAQGLKRAGSAEQVRFADDVVSWAEQPEAAAMLSRTMTGFGGMPVHPLGGRESEAACFPQAPPQNLPSRVLVFDSSLPHMQVSVAAGSRVEVPMKPGDAEVIFIYMVPIYPDPAVFDRVVSDVVDSLVRIQQLLWDPHHGLDGRRDPAQAGQLMASLQMMEVIPSLALVPGLR